MTTRRSESLRTGFTLIELMVVVVIIAILAAILFPVFGQAREVARSVDCKEHLSQLGEALQLYAHDYDGRLPPTDNDLRPLLDGWLPGPALFHCPDDFLPIDRMEVGGKLYTSYQYRGGLSIEDRPDIPIACDWELRHNGNANVLYLCGSTKLVNPNTTSGKTPWVPVGRGPRRLPPGVSLPPGLAPVPFRTSPATKRPHAKEKIR